MARSLRTRREIRPAAPHDWAAEAKRLAEALTEAHLEQLAHSTGIPAAAWSLLSPGWASGEDLRTLRAGGAGWSDAPPVGAWAIAEFSGAGRLVGLSLRAEDGRKGAPAGAKRGLVLPSDLHQRPDPVLIVEGASDVATCCALGLAAVGRPSNRAGADDLAQMLEGRTVLVVGERDGKVTGAWPGRDGARGIAQQLAGRWEQEIHWTLPPRGVKDVRDWLRAKLGAGLNSSNAEAMNRAGAELLAELESAAKIAKAERRTQADALVDLAQSIYRLGVNADSEAFALTHDGPAVALMFRGGASGLRTALAKAYRQQTNKTPSSSALTDALQALEGMAQDAAPEPVALRVARFAQGIVLDLGCTTGQVVLVTADDWTLVPISPLLFRRTRLTAPLPEPVQAEPADLALLRGLLNVGDDTWPLVVGWLVAALLPDIPHPVLMLGGEQGTGKSSAARLLVGLIDPSPAPSRSEPRDPQNWAVAASSSWVVALDNVSHVQHWLSDALCKAVTGDGSVQRKLYTDSDVSVLCFRRCIIVTSIDTGALRGDLGDRLLLADLERIPEQQRRTETELEEAYQAIRPRLVGALLSALSRTLAALPNVRLQSRPRMADFAQVLSALDTACPELTGGQALPLFVGQRGRIADDVVESDAVASAIVRFVEARETWRGTASELLAATTPDRPPKGWPATARGLSGQLRRITPALRALAVEVRFDREPGGSRSRIISIEKAGERPSQPARPAPGLVENTPSGAESRLSGRNADHSGRSDSVDAAPEGPINAGTQDDRDGRDDPAPVISIDADGRQRVRI